MNKHFEYTFLKSELTLEIVLIIRMEKEWFEKEIDFSINDEEIEIFVENQKFTSGKLPSLVKFWIKNNVTNVFFANEEGHIVSEAMVGGM